MYLIMYMQHYNIIIYVKQEEYYSTVTKYRGGGGV